VIVLSGFNCKVVQWNDQAQLYRCKNEGRARFPPHCCRRVMEWMNDALYLEEIWDLCFSCREHALLAPSDVK